MSKTIVVRKARTPVAFIVVDESQNGTRLLRPTALPVVEATAKPKAPEPQRPCEDTSKRAAPPKRQPARDERFALLVSNSGRGNRRQLREMCNAIVVHRHFV